MKVFSKKKHDDALGSPYDGYKWTLTCDGKTEEECASLGYIIDDEWLAPATQDTAKIKGAKPPCNSKEKENEKVFKVFDRC